MITARIAVHYDGDWTAYSVEHDVYGKCLAYSFQNNRHFSLFVISSNDVEATIDLIRDHDHITEVSVLEQRNMPKGIRRAATISVKSKYRTIPPMELLSYEGFLPIGYPSIYRGRIFFDLLLDGREDLNQVVELLDEFGDARVEYLSEELLYQRAPTLDEFQALMKSLSPKQIEILMLAVEMGYFEDNRAVTIEELAAELEITKTTASMHLRKAWGKVMEFIHCNITEPRAT